MDHSPPGSSVHGILQARILEWVAIPSSGGSSWPRDGTQISCIAGEFFTSWVTRQPLLLLSLLLFSCQSVSNSSWPLLLSNRYERYQPSVKGSLSNGTNERSRAGFVLLSMEGAGTGRERDWSQFTEKSIGRGRRAGGQERVAPCSRLAVLWFRLLLGSSWLGWGGGSGCFNRNPRVRKHFPPVSKPWELYPPNRSESVHFSPSRGRVPVRVSRERSPLFHTLGEHLLHVTALPSFLVAPITLGTKLNPPWPARPCLGGLLPPPLRVPLSGHTGLSP